MDRLGTFALALSLAISVYGVAASVIGARRDRPLLVESARTSAYSLFLLVLAANLVMEAAILANDFSLRYVFENSSRETPVFFKVLALWSADEGSLLLWNLILSGYIAAVAFRFRRRRPETLPWVLAVMYVVQVFYLLLVLGPTRPFAAFAVGAARRARAAAAAAEPSADGRAPAVPVPRLHRVLRAVRVRDGGADHGPPVGRVDPGHAALDAVRVDLPDDRSAAGRALVLRRARVGRLLGVGPGGERRAAALAGRDGAAALGDAAGAARHAEGLEPGARRGRVRPHHVRDVPHPGQHPVVGPHVRAVGGRARCTSGSWCWSCWAASG